jgi:hypothetical protein
MAFQYRAPQLFDSSGKHFAYIRHTAMEFEGHDSKHANVCVLDIWKEEEIVS